MPFLRGDHGGVGWSLQGSGGGGGNGSFVITPVAYMVVCQLVLKCITWISEAQEESLSLQPAARGLPLAAAHFVVWVLWHPTPCCPACTDLPFLMCAPSRSGSTVWRCLGWCRAEHKVGYPAVWGEGKPTQSIGMDWKAEIAACLLAASIAASME